ncbi:MAG: hypothetical protein ABSH20_21425, partial [Tepidisphaeraceae bacterium]
MLLVMSDGAISAVANPVGAPSPLSSAPETGFMAFQMSAMLFPASMMFSSASKAARFPATALEAICTLPGVPCIAPS